jgi:hypothetical protein
MLGELIRTHGPIHRQGCRSYWCVSYPAVDMSPLRWQYPLFILNYVIFADRVARSEMTMEEAHQV